MISSIIGQIVIPLMMFMLVIIYLTIMFAEYWCSSLWDWCKKICRIIYKLNKKRKD